MARLRIAREARGDLRDIRVFSKGKFGAATAKTNLMGLDETFAKLIARSLIGAAQGDLPAGVRAFSYRSHRIYYRITDDEVLILRILHHARSDARSWLT